MFQFRKGRTDITYLESVSIRHLLSGLACHPRVIMAVFPLPRAIRRDTSMIVNGKCLQVAGDDLPQGLLVNLQSEMLAAMGLE